jgi:glyoxalase family protein
MTTFPYRDIGVRVGTQGAGQITVTSFSVPVGSLPFWRRRLATAGVSWVDEATGFGEDALRFTDPSGLTIRLVEGATDDRTPWRKSDIEDAMAVRGIHGVTLRLRDPAKTLAFMSDFMDVAVVDENDRGMRVAVNGNAPGRLVELAHAPDAPAAINGLGTVHHVAFAVDDPQQQLELRKELVSRGVAVTDVMDRQYFRSIYFREPGGVLFEVATIPPGFTADESLADLGTGLKLPPWEEARRAEIETGLPVVTTS